MLKNPLKRHSRYMTFDAIAGYVDHSTVSSREIYAFPTTLSILRQYAQKALCLKTPLSRGETGKTFTDTENKKIIIIYPFSDWFATGNPVIMWLARLTLFAGMSLSLALQLFIIIWSKYHIYVIKK